MTCSSEKLQNVKAIVFMFNVFWLWSQNTLWLSAGLSINTILTALDSLQRLLLTICPTATRQLPSFEPAIAVCVCVCMPHLFLTSTKKAQHKFERNGQ